jgi:hypothetical protein
MTPVASVPASANPFLGWGPAEAARRHVAGDPVQFASFGPAAAAVRARAGIAPQARFAALVARRADTVGAAPDGVEMRAYGDMAPIAFAVRGRSAEAIETASAAMARVTRPSPEAVAEARRP